MLPLGWAATDVAGMHVIAVLVQVTLLSQLMDKMPAVGYETWIVGWCVVIHPITAVTLD